MYVTDQVIKAVYTANCSQSTDRRTDTGRPAATEEKELENAARGNVASSPIFKGKANHRLRCLKGPASLSLFLSFFISIRAQIAAPITAIPCVTHLTILSTFLLMKLP